MFLERTQDLGLLNQHTTFVFLVSNNYYNGNIVQLLQHVQPYNNYYNMYNHNIEETFVLVH